MLGVLFTVTALAADPPTITAAPGKGFQVTTADEKFQIGLRARFQARTQLTIAPPDDDGERALTTYTGVKTTRLYVEGHVFDPDVKYLVQLAVAGSDYRDGATSPLFDAYIDDRRNPNLSVKVGQYFVPFDRLRTVRESSLELTDRPIAVSELTLDRDVGVTLYSDHLGGAKSPFAYRVGYFGGGGTNLSAFRSAGGMGVARVELRPLGEIDDDSEGDLQRREKPGLAIGLGAAYNLNTNRARSTTSTTYALGTVDYLNLAADLSFKVRGFALEGEYLMRKATSDVELTGADADGDPISEYARPGSGFVGQASYMLDKHVQVAGRASMITADPDADPKFVSDADAKGTEVGAGVNYYINGHKGKVQAGWTAIFGEDGFAEGTSTVTVLTDWTF